jgi:formylglycine-generating enzyme required for sulfatase activity
MGRSLKELFAVAALSALAGCATLSPRQPPAEPAPKIRSSNAPAISSEPVASEAPEPEQPPPVTASGCPEDMALVRRNQGGYCIDRFEATIVEVKADGSTVPHAFNRSIDGIEKTSRAVSQRGKKPQGYISGIQAATACKNAGKRLCEVDEWVRACRGPKLTRYPYGNVRRANVCNDRFKVLDHHPVPILWKKDPLDPLNEKLMWHPKFMNDPRLLEMDHTVVPTGSFAECTNDYGVYDMVGNLHEWVNDPEGTFFGGFFMDTYQNGEGCEYRTKGHGFEYHDYSTGFRCCKDSA